MTTTQQPEALRLADALQREWSIDEPISYQTVDEASAVLRDILWPKPEPLFHIMKGDLYFAPNYCGYRNNPTDAGKYTEAELKPYASDIKNGTLRAVPVAA